MAIGDALRVVAGLFAERLVDSTVDSAEDYASGFGLRHPRALRFARIVGGAFIALGGLWEVVLTITVFVYVVISEGFQVALFVLLLPLAMGIGLLVWGVGLMRRGLRAPPHPRDRGAGVAVMTGAMTCPRCDSERLAITTRGAFPTGMRDTPPPEAYGDWWTCEDCAHAWPADDEPGRDRRIGVGASASG